jgi:hypothetical protein
VLSMIYIHRTSSVSQSSFMHGGVNLELRHEADKWESEIGLSHRRIPNKSTEFKSGISSLVSFTAMLCSMLSVLCYLLMEREGSIKCKSSRCGKM